MDIKIFSILQSKILFISSNDWTLLHEESLVIQSISKVVKPAKMYKIFGLGPANPVFGVYNQVRLKQARILNITK